MGLKLIKNEFKDASNKFLPIVGMIATVTVLILLPILMQQNMQVAFFNAMLVLIIFAFFVAIVVMMFMATINLLYTSLYDKNGYRLFTLPVNSWEIILAKSVVFFLWTSIIALITYVAFTVIVLVAFGNNDLIILIKSFINYVLNEAGLQVILVGLFSVFSSYVMLISLFLLVGSIINSSYIRTRRKMKMFLGFVFLNTLINQLLYYLNLQPKDVVDISLTDKIFGIGMYNPLVNGWRELIQITAQPAGISATMLSSIVYLALAGIFFILTTYFWNNKLEIID